MKLVVNVTGELNIDEEKMSELGGDVAEAFKNGTIIFKIGKFEILNEDGEDIITEEDMLEMDEVVSKVINKIAEKA